MALAGTPKRPRKGGRKRANLGEFEPRAVRIRQLRIERGLTTLALAQLAGISPQTVSMVERLSLTREGYLAAGQRAFAKLEIALGIAA